MLKVNKKKLKLSVESYYKYRHTKIYGYVD